MDGLWKILLKWTVWWYPHFRKPPYIYHKPRLLDLFTPCWKIVGRPTTLLQSPLATSNVDAATEHIRTAVASKI